jgi:hypothetical protein
MYLADNGWHLPNSKHNFTENGYRTRLIVFDPRTLPEVPNADPALVAPRTPYESAAVAHATDVLPTVLGFALGPVGSQACPVSTVDGKPCDGRDLRPHLFTAPNGPAAPETLRKSLCGHHTQRGTSPTRQRYILTRGGAVGRCVNQAGASCASSAQCGAGQACVAGRCMGSAEPACGSTAQCAAGAVCLGGKCRVAPSCTDNADCTRLFPAGNYTCTAKGTKWCRNDPTRSCQTRDDCPLCPVVNGVETACGRLCEPRMLKFYERFSRSGELVDLFLDPDEHGLHGSRGGPSVASDMSSESGPYAGTMAKLACCVQNWWPEAGTGGLCSGGATCPADLACN